jgi:hypothetical protein
MSKHRWDHQPHHLQADILDGDWGRFLVQRVSKGSRTFAFYVNGHRTGHAGTRQMMRDLAERTADHHTRTQVECEAMRSALVPHIATPLLARLAVEWGYKQCEKGHNLEAAIQNFEALMKGEKR